MSSNTRTRKFEQSVVEGLEETDLTPEAFDREEDERRRRLARAFAHLADDAPEISLAEDEDAPAAPSKTRSEPV